MRKREKGKERRLQRGRELLDNKHHTTTITFYLIRESDNQTQTELGCTISCAIKHVYIMYKLSGTCCVCCVTLFVLNSIALVQTLQHPAFSRLQYRKGLKLDGYHKNVGPGLRVCKAKHVMPS